MGEAPKLPEDYRRQLDKARLTPLWGSPSNALPHGRPAKQTLPNLWKHEAIKPLLLQTGALFHVAKGSGTSVVDGEEFTEPAFIIRIDDEPLHKKLKFSQEKTQG